MGTDDMQDALEKAPDHDIDDLDMVTIVIEDALPTGEEDIPEPTVTTPDEHVEPELLEEQTESEPASGDDTLAEDEAPEQEAVAEADPYEEVAEEEAVAEAEAPEETVTEDEQLAETAVVPHVKPEPEPTVETVPEPATEQPVSRLAGLKSKVKPWMLGVLAVALVGIAVAVHFANLSKRYDEAVAEYNASHFENAAQLFQDLGDYKDAADRTALATLWVDAESAEDAAGTSPEKWKAAAEAYDAIPDDTRASDDADRCRDTATYYEALALIEGDGMQKEANLKKAIELFESCNGVLDADSQISYCESGLTYLDAKKLMSQGKWSEAATKFDSISESGIADAASLRQECYDHAAYAEAEAEYDAGHYYDAYNRFLELKWQMEDASYDWLPDLNKRAEACKYTMPESSVMYRNNNYGDGCELTIDNTGFDNAYYKLYFGDELIVAVFVASDSTYTFLLPSGTYRMNKAYGDEWWGPDDMFGDEGRYLACSFGGQDEVTLEYNNGYMISTGSGGTGIGTSYTDRNSF